MQLTWARLGYPLCLVTVIAITSWCLAVGVGPLVIIALAALTSVSFALIGEWLKPFRDHWRATLKDDYAPDSFFFVLNNLLLQSSLLQLAIAAFAVSLAGGGFEIWPHHWPIWIQVPLGLILAEFGSYWWHRAAHELPLLWRFHQLHHSPARLYWLNATRFHYIDVTMQQAASTIPLLLFGAGEVVVLWSTLFAAFHGYWQHGNTEQKLGWLNYIVSGAELHRWHHNFEAEVSNHNYGSNFIFWDLVFGTFLWPERGHGSAKLPIDQIGNDNPDYPENRAPLKQLWYPFQPGGKHGETT